MERGAGRIILDRLPFDVPGALAALKGVSQLILVGAKTPVAFFAYPDQPSLLVPKECEIGVLAQAEHDIESALEALACELGAVACAPVFRSRGCRSGKIRGLCADSCEFSQTGTTDR